MRSSLQSCSLGEFRPCPEIVGVVQRVLHLGREGESRAARSTLASLLRTLSRIDHFPGDVIDELVEHRTLARDPAETGSSRLLAELRSEIARCRNAPDLLDTCELSPEDGAWLREVYEELNECARLRPGLRLSHCQLVPGPRGHVALSFVQHHVARHVARGDRILAGFSALRPAGGALRIRPRIYRVLCTNGLIVPSVAAEELGGQEPGGEGGGVRGAVRHCMSGTVVERATHCLRAAQGVRVADPFEAFPQLAGTRHAPSIRADFELAGNASLFGALNAVTAAAREEPDLARRAQLEALCGHVLCDAPRSLAKAHSLGRELSLRG